MKIKKLGLKIRRLTYSILASIDKLLGLENRQIIFALHGVSSSAWYYNNSASFIKKLVTTLIKNGWEPGRLTDLKENARWGRKNFYLTFDDGYKNVLRISQFLNGKDIFPTAFLISDTESRNLEQLTTNEPMLESRDIKVLKKLGWEFGSHSRTHNDFYRLKTEASIRREVVDSKTELTKKYDIEVKYFAYPRGRYNRKIVKQIKIAGYKYALTMDDSLIDSNTKNYLIPRVGLDSSHTVAEAMNSASPSVIRLRSIIKEILKKIKYL